LSVQAVSWLGSCEVLKRHPGKPVQHPTNCLTTELPAVRKRDLKAYAVRAQAVFPARTVSKQLSIFVNKLVKITTLKITKGTVGTQYSFSLSATRGKQPYSWSLASGNLPAGLTLDTSGTISGNPTTAGTSSFTAQVADSLEGSAQKSFSMKVK